MLCCWTPIIDSALLKVHVHQGSEPTIPATMPYARSSTDHITDLLGCLMPTLQKHLSVCEHVSRKKLILTPSAGISEASDSMGYRGSLMFHGSSAEAIGNIVAVSFPFCQDVWVPCMSCHADPKGHASCKLPSCPC
jgi:hypothetical protein